MSPTPKQKIAPQKISEAGDKGKGLRAAGYSESVSKSPTLVTESKGFKEAAKPYIDQLIALRDKAIKRAEKTVNKANFADAARSTENFTKQIQLLGGKPTEIHDWSNMSNEDLAKLANASNTDTGKVGASKKRAS